MRIPIPLSRRKKIVHRIAVLCAIPCFIAPILLIDPNDTVGVLPRILWLYGAVYLIAFPAIEFFAFRERFYERYFSKLNKRIDTNH